MLLRTRFSGLVLTLMCSNLGVVAEVVQLEPSVLEWDRLLFPVRAALLGGRACDQSVEKISPTLQQSYR